LLPKCGSSFIGQNLLLQGFQLYKLADLLKVVPNLNSFFIWTIIRHPVSRFVSAYNELKRRKSEICFWTKNNGKELSLSEYLLYAEQNPNFEPHMALQTYYLEPFKGLINCIGFLDTLEDDLAQNNIVNIKKDVCWNKSEESAAPLSLTASDIKKIEELYKDDLILYNTWKQKRLKDTGKFSERKIKNLLNF
jgi:hypothetical protein